MTLPKFLKNLTMSETKEKRVSQKMTQLGIVMWCIGATRIHKDGDCYTSVFRRWHPAYWLLLIVLLPFCAILGEPMFSVAPYKLSDYWEKRKERLEWVYPFDEI